MKQKLLWAACGAIIACAGLWLFGGYMRDNAPRTIAVSGECLTAVPRDRTAITMRVTVLDKNAATSMKRATTQVAAITEFLKGLDIEMQTTEFNSYEKTEWNRELQKSETLGIETTIATEISCTDIALIEKVMAKFAGTPSIYFENLRMYTSAKTMQSALEECLGTAVENARARANALAAGTGNRAGKMLSVSYDASPTNVFRPRTPNLMMASAKSMSSEMTMDSVAGTLVTKNTDVSVSVSAIFEIR